MTVLRLRKDKYTCYVPFHIDNLTQYFFLLTQKEPQNPQPNAQGSHYEYIGASMQFRNYSPSLLHLWFRISLSHEYHEVGKDGLNQIWSFQKSQNGSSQGNPGCRLQTDFLWLKSILIFFFLITGCQH